jgi:transmembrane sensor
MTETEMQSFKAWLAAAPRNRDAFDTERRFWHRLSDLEAPQASGSQVKGSRAKGGPSIGYRRTGAVVLALAACLALFVALGGHFPGVLIADHETAAGAQERVNLPDGSVVYLNTDTALRVAFAAQERRIELLYGEALFQVAPDKSRPFRVSAGGGVAEAVGTAFSVRIGTPEDGGRTRVTVTEGVVRVASPSAAEETALRLKVGQQTSFLHGGAPEAIRAVSARDALAWRRGTIRIDDLPLDAAVAELDRYLPGRVVMFAGETGLEKVSGAFDIDKVPAALQGLAATHGLKVTSVSSYLTIVH